MFKLETSSLIEYYKDHEGFCEIDGNKEISQISEQIKAFLGI